MVNVFVCGAEALTVPLPTDADFNARRFAAVRDFLTFELAALLSAGLITSVNYEPTTAVAMFFDGTVSTVCPAGVTPVAVRFAQVTTTFAIDSTLMVYHINGGQNFNAATLAAIATIKAQAIAAGVLWRDACNLGANDPLGPDKPRGPSSKPNALT
jgi:hypothetical protein